MKLFKKRTPQKGRESIVLTKNSSPTPSAIRDSNSIATSSLISPASHNKNLSFSTSPYSASSVQTDAVASFKKSPSVNQGSSKSKSSTAFNPFCDDTNDDQKKPSGTLDNILNRLEEHKQQQEQQQSSIFEFHDDFFPTGEVSLFKKGSVHTNTTSSSAVDLDSVLDMYDVKMMCFEVLDCMTKSPNSVSVQRDGAKALCGLAQVLQDQYDGDKEAMDVHENPILIMSNGVENLLTAMEDFPDDESLQCEACIALESLTHWTQNQDIIVTTGRLEEILVAMDEFVENLPLQLAAMGLLRNLAQNPLAKEDETTARQLKHAIPCILDNLKNHKNDGHVFEKGCMALAAITNNNQSSQQLLWKDQLGIRVVVEALHKFCKPGNERIQLAAMETLEHVASHPSPECKGKIVIQGGLERIIESIERSTISTTRISSREDEIEEESMYGDSCQPNDIFIRIIASGLRALSLIAISSSAMSVSDQFQTKLGKAIKVILNVLRHHPKKSDIQVGGFSALKHLASSHTELIASYGGISTILISMSDNPTNSDLQEQACGALNSMLSSPQAGANSLDLVHTVATEDGLTIIFACIRMHQAHPALQESAFGVLYYLSCSRDLPASQKRQLCLEENIFVLLATMNQLIENELLCHRACGLILNISFFAPISQDVMASVGGIRIILSAMRRHGLNVQIQEFGAGVLSGLCLDERNHLEFVNEEGISTILAACMIHPDQPSIQACCCDLLVNLATADPSYKRFIVDGNGVMIAKDAMVRHQSHKGIQNRGRELLDALS